MKYLTSDEVLAIHFEIIRKFGGLQGIRDFGLLFGSVERSKATFDGKDLYVSLFDKAATLMHSLVLNHPFVDGNKRTAYVATVRLLHINGYKFEVSSDEMISFLLFIENKKPKIDAIAKWIEMRTVKSK